MAEFTDLQHEPLRTLVETHGAGEIMERVKELTPRRACPECGDQHHLYGRADVRWDPGAQAWVVGDMEADIECTECDWSGSEEDMTPKPGQLEIADPETCAHCGEERGLGPETSGWLCGACNGFNEPVEGGA